MRRGLVCGSGSLNGEGWRCGTAAIVRLAVRLGPADGPHCTSVEIGAAQIEAARLANQLATTPQQFGPAVRTEIGNIALGGWQPWRLQ